MISDEFFRAQFGAWYDFLQDEIRSSYFVALQEFVEEERRNCLVFPPAEQVFRAFQCTPPEAVRVVMLGQDPYHGEKQAEGLAFSVPKQTKLPPSLLNIFKELQYDLGIESPSCGSLVGWAQQGVLLLNTTLTVRAHEPLSHQKRGWERFTDAVIARLSERRAGIVFLLWGNPAKAKIPLIDAQKHFILTAAHPSPLSARRGFFGCAHFSKTNEILKQIGCPEINWKQTT